MTERTAATPRPYSVRLYPGARVRLSNAWMAGELRFSAGSLGWIRGWGKDNRPQVEFDNARGQMISVAEESLVAI